MVIRGIWDVQVRNSNEFQVCTAQVPEKSTFKSHHTHCPTNCLLPRNAQGDRSEHAVTCVRMRECVTA